MIEILLAIGSNLGDRVDYITKAYNLCEKYLGPIKNKSKLYETAPIGASDQTFLNGAFTLSTTMPVEEAMNSILKIEEDLGRERTVHWGNRTIDIDILLCRQLNHTPIVSDTELLKIPHPHMLKRDFVLIPACEVAPQWLFPSTQKSLKDILRSYNYSELDIYHGK